MPWKVPAQGNAPAVASAPVPGASPQIRVTRRDISTAARRENVISRIRDGSAPSEISRATRWASVLVLPDPAPAMISSGPGASSAPRP